MYLYLLPTIIMSFSELDFQQLLFGQHLIKDFVASSSPCSGLYSFQKSYISQFALGLFAACYDRPVCELFQQTLQLDGIVSVLLVF